MKDEGHTFQKRLFMMCSLVEALERFEVGVKTAVLYLLILNFLCGQNIVFEQII